MTQIKIISDNNISSLEEGVNRFLSAHKTIISAVIDIKFKMKERNNGLPGAVVIFAYIIYSVK